MNKILLLLTIFVCTVYAFNIEQEFNIKTVKVQSKEISDYKEFYGKIVPDSSKVYDINLRFDAFIIGLYKSDEFTFVNKGDKLFDVYSESIYNLYDELSIAKNRSNTLYRSILKKFELFDIDPKNKTKNNSTTVKSKYKGFITKHTINEGSFVKKGQKILELTDLSKVWAVINIYQKDASYIKEGMTVDIKVDGLDNIYRSKIGYIYPNINPKDQTLSARVELNNEDLKLFPNMFAKALIYQTKQKMLIVPKNAVVQRDGKQYVFFKEGKTYTPSEIKGVRIPQGYQVLSGLEQGDEIVTNALFLLDSDAVTNGLYSDDW